MGVEPTKLIAAMSGWRRRASTVSLSPFKTVKTPSGRPASVSQSAINRDAEGSRSDGFRMKQLPQASATGNIHIGTIAGIFREVAFQQLWRASREFHYLQTALNFTLCIGNYL